MSGLVVITGGTGFTGRYVSQVFANHGYQVLPLSGSSKKTVGSQTGISCDITDKDSIRQALCGRSVAGVIHLAAESFVAETDLSRFYTSQIINLCTGRAISIREILARLNLICGYEIEVVRNPDLIRTTEIMHLSGSNRKLLAATGFVPDFTNALLERMLSSPEQRPV